jgi:hypothetical protein
VNQARTQRGPGFDPRASSISPCEPSNSPRTKFLSRLKLVAVISF